MKTIRKREIGIRIDKITESIVNTISGDSFQTEITKVNKDIALRIIPDVWLFDWQEEFKRKGVEVYMLSISGNINIIQGLVSVTDRGDHLFLNLIESAEFNKGKRKLYLGVPGNLVAFCCKKSFDMGYEGYVAFTSKTKLIEHYQRSLGATLVKGQQMMITPPVAIKLIHQYFKL